MDARWACAYDGEDGKLVDMVDGHDSAALDGWYAQFGPEERNKVHAFCSDMTGSFLAASRKWLPLAVRAVDRSRAAKGSVVHMDKARRRTQKRAGNGALVKRRTRKLVASWDKRRCERGGEKWAGKEKAVTCEALRACDEKRAHLRQVFVAFQLCHEW